MLRGERRWVLITAMLAFATLGSGIGLIATASYLISRSALVDSTASLAVAITGVRFFAVCRAVFRYLERFVGHLATFRVLTRLRVSFFRGIEPLAPSRLGGHRSGDLLASILGDIDTLQDFSLRVAVPALAAGLTTALVAVVLGSFSIVLAVAVVAYLALVGLLLPALTRRIGREPAGAATTVRVALEADAVEMLSGLPELVAWGREDHLTDAVERRTEQLNDIDAKLSQLRGMAVGLGALLVGLGSMTLLGLAVPLVTHGKIEGVYLALMPLTAIVAFEAVQPLSAAMEHLSAARAAAGRIDDLIETEPSVTEPREPKMPPAPTSRTDGLSLEFNAVTFSYDKDTDSVLEDVTMRIPTGAHAVVVGPSGSGKSTLLGILLRFWDYSAGSVRVGETELRDLALADARGLFATVEQHDHLFDTTVRDNLLLADPDADEGRMFAALDAAEAKQFVADLPGALDYRVGENGNRLSGGERQRLMIARALLADCPVLVLDEATVHLDPPTETRVLSGIRRWQANRTLIVISHQVPPDTDADLIIRLDHGRCHVDSGHQN